MQPRGTSQLKKLQNGVEILRRQYSIILEYWKYLGKTILSEPRVSKDQLSQI